MAAIKAAVLAAMLVGLTLGAAWNAAGGDLPTPPYPLCSVLPEAGLVAAWEFEVWDARPTKPFGLPTPWTDDSTIDCVSGLAAVLGRTSGPDRHDPTHQAPFAPTPLSSGHYDVTPEGTTVKFLTVSVSDLYRTPTFTWTAWVNMTSFHSPPVDYSEVLGIENGYGSEGSVALHVVKDPSCTTACRGSVRLIYVCPGINNEAFSPYLVTTGAWHHLGGSYDGTSVRVFLDGQLVGEKATVPCLTWDETPLFIGARGGIRDEGVSGAVDGIRLYDLAIHPADLAASYEAQRAAYGR